HVMNGQRGVVKGDPMAERALREGIKHWQTAYGEQLMNAVRKQLRAREWRQALPSLIGLLQYHPGGFFHHAYRKISRVAGGAKPYGLDEIGLTDRRRAVRRHGDDLHLHQAPPAAGCAREPRLEPGQRRRLL